MSLLKFHNLNEITVDSLDKLQKLCRLCLKMCDTLVLLSSHYSESIGLKFSDMWEYFVENRVMDDIYRPKFICLECVDQLQGAYCFKLSAQNAEILLNNHLLHLQKKNDDLNIKDMSDVDEEIDNEELQNDVFDAENIHIIAESFDAEIDGKQQEYVIEENVEIEGAIEGEFLKSECYINRIMCDVCQTSFDTNIELHRHMTIHDKNHLCTHCGKFFKRADTLKKHIRIHTGEKPYKCNICSKEYRQSFLLKDHLRFHRNEKYICNECGKELSSYNTLNVHMKYHRGIKNYHCHVCSSSFTLSGHLKEHLKIHTDEKPFACLICRKRFRSKGLLTIHNRTHSGERPYKCDCCPKAFPSASKLTLHKRSHTGEKPYSCDFCDKNFVKSQDLSRHLNVHTDHKPFECTICNQFFLNYFKLKKHVKDTHARVVVTEK